MSYMLLYEVLPCDVVELIYEFMKVNAANVIRNYFNNAKKRYSVFVYLSHYSIADISALSIYSINSMYNANFVIHSINSIVGNSNVVVSSNIKDEVIEDLYKHLMFMYNAYYIRANYTRCGWSNVLGNVSQLLMYYYNRLAFSDSLKKKNSNYVYLKACIELWFKLCQKYNLYLVLCYLDSAKKVNRNIKAIKLRPITNFMDFRIAPLVTHFKIHEHRFKYEQGLLRHHSLLPFNADEQRRY